jgi:hypothetical protein
MPRGISDQYTILSRYDDMDYATLADIMWYVGHVITAMSIVVNHFNFPAAAVTVFVGQAITMISRPVGRIKGKPQIWGESRELECTVIPGRGRIGPASWGPPS